MTGSVIALHYSFIIGIHFVNNYSETGGNKDLKPNHWLSG
jgi:hypothetical protein